MSKKTRIPPGKIATLQTGWRDVAFICRKCGKKLGGGFGRHGERTLREVLREGLRGRGRRGELGLVEVGCLGVCPKGAVTMALASAPGKWLIVGAGADPAAILDRSPVAPYATPDMPAE